MREKRHQEQGDIKGKSALPVYSLNVAPKKGFLLMRSCIPASQEHNPFAKFPSKNLGLSSCIAEAT